MTQPPSEFQVRLSYLLDLCNGAYRSYMSEGQTYAYACSIFAINEEIERLLLLHGHSVAQDLRPDVQAMFAHIQDWKVRWLHHRKISGGLAPDDRFEFKTDLSFPAQSAKRLVAGQADLE